MATHYAATGSNNTSGLAALSPQPAFSGVMYPEDSRVYGLNGVEGESMKQMGILAYETLLPSELVSLYTQLGLTSAISALITFRTVDDDRSTVSTYNATVSRPIRPRAGKFEMGMYHDVEFIVKEMVEI